MTTRIKIDYTKCIGCFLCEIVCSLHHTDTINPKRSRIRSLIEGNLFYPVLAGPYTDAECTVKGTVIIDGKEYNECAICRASCPAKPVFKEPDSEIPLKCDACGEPPDPECVKWCFPKALILVEEEEEKKD